MTLKDCTKDELIFVIERLQFRAGSVGTQYLRFALREVERQRENAKYEKASELLDYAARKHLEYIHLLEPYAGQQVVDIPADVLEKAEAARKECESANRKWCKITGIN